MERIRGESIFRKKKKEKKKNTACSLLPCGVFPLGSMDCTDSPSHKSPLCCAAASARLDAVEDAGDIHATREYDKRRGCLFSSVTAVVMLLRARAGTISSYRISVSPFLSGLLSTRSGVQND